MTDREMLIEILQKNIYMNEGEEEVVAIARHLLSNGVIVPPCKAGDTVYFLDLRNLIIRKLEVIEIKLTSPKAMLLNLSDGYLHGAYDFGISLFYTREEAEKALAERKGNNEK